MPVKPRKVRSTDGPRRTGIEFRQFPELELLDHLAREVARQDELDLARHCFLVHGGAALGSVLFGIRAKKNVLPGLDQDPGFGAVSWRNQIDADEGNAASRQA